MHLNIQRQEAYNRGLLLARQFFGGIYILFPHFILLFFVLLWAKLTWLYVTFYILLKGNYPEKSRVFLVDVMKWLSRLHASLYHLTDTYPVMGLQKEVDYLELKYTVPNQIDRLSVLVRFIFGSVMLLPHVVVWTLRNIWNSVLVFLAFWVVLFTGKYPEKWFDFQVGTLRWLLRIVGYQLYLEDQYPSFTGNE